MLLFEYLLLAGQFAGSYYLRIKKKKGIDSQVWACLETRPTYLAGKTMRRSRLDIFGLLAKRNFI